MSIGIAKTAANMGEPSPTRFHSTSRISEPELVTTSSFEGVTWLGLPKQSSGLSDGTA